MPKKLTPCELCNKSKNFRMFPFQKGVYLIKYPLLDNKWTCRDCHEASMRGRI